MCIAVQAGLCGPNRSQFCIPCVFVLQASFSTPRSPSLRTTVPGQPPEAQRPRGLPAVGSAGSAAAVLRPNPLPPLAQDPRMERGLHAVTKAGTARPGGRGLERCRLRATFAGSFPLHGSVFNPFPPLIPILDPFSVTPNPQISGPPGMIHKPMSLDTHRK